MIDDDDVTTIWVCQGPPNCTLQGDDAVTAQKAGCVWCRYIRVDEDGNEFEGGPGHA